ncbi:hypothetical protein RB195_024506 [Necator americanus]|uniref:Uncharacterized protein n=1 Tax=Necator americanus TaxID=51031 RepID=A0ABR1ENK4_NECAM
MTKNIRLRAHLFNTTVLLALCHASETWAFCKQEENSISVIERGIERVMLGVTHFTQVKKGIRSSLLRHRSKIRDAAAYTKESKIGWVEHVMRFNDSRQSTSPEGRRPDGQKSLRNPSEKNTMLFDSLARIDATGQHLQAIGTNGSISGARLSKQMNNGSTGDRQVMNKAKRIGYGYRMKRQLIECTYQ